MKIGFLIILSFFFVGCAESTKSASKAEKKSKSYIPLSLEQSKKLITPTIYSIPTFEIDQMTCAANTKMRDVKGKTLFTVCSEVFSACQMEGTCRIQQAGKIVLLNVDSVLSGERRFIAIFDSVCQFGKGARRDRVQGFKSMCLDPYHSIAADLKIYNLGDVIYIPAAVGAALPDGSIHDGHFVIRDTGGSIKGYGRFDFFLGLKSNAAGGAFRQLGFSDKSTNVPYYVVTGSEAAEILKKRNFPSLPDSE